MRFKLRQTTILKLLAILVLPVALYQSCGPSKKSNNQDPYYPYGRGGGPVPPGGGANLLTYCNTFRSAALTAPFSGLLSGQLHTYLPTPNNEKILINLASLPPELLSSTTTYLQFWAWLPSSTPDANGVVQPLFSSPLYLSVQRKGSSNEYGPLGSASGSTINPVVSKAALELIINNNRGTLGAEGTTPANIFINYYLVLSGVEWQYQALRLALFDSSRTNPTEAVTYIDALIPPFLVGPTAYSYSHHSLVQALHPFRGAPTSTTDQTHLTNMNTSCANVFY